MLTTTGHAPGDEVFGAPELSGDELRGVVTAARQPVVA